MDQERRTSRMTIAGLLVAALAIVGLAVVTSKPFQETVAQTEMVQETISEAAPDQLSDPADQEPSKAASEKPAEAADGALSKVAAATTSEVADDASSEPADEPPSGGDAADESGSATCCKPGDKTLPTELVKKFPPGQLHSPYPDYKKLAEKEELVKQYRLPGCNECHGGGGGGGFCPALSQGVWFWGNTDDVLFRLVTLGSAELEKQGFKRLQWGTVHGPMPPMAVSIKSSDQLWKIIAFIRSINPPGTNPPEKIVPPKWAPPGEGK